MARCLRKQLQSITTRRRINSDSRTKDAGLEGRKGSPESSLFRFRATPAASQKSTNCAGQSCTTPKLLAVNKQTRIAWLSQRPQPKEHAQCLPLLTMPREERGCALEAKQGGFSNAARAAVQASAPSSNNVEAVITPSHVCPKHPLGLSSPSHDELLQARLLASVCLIE